METAECPYCGEKIEIGCKICPHCENPILWTSADEVSEDADTSNNNEANSVVDPSNNQEENLSEATAWSEEVVDNKDDLPKNTQWLAELHSLWSLLSFVIPPVGWIFYIKYRNISNEQVHKSVKKCLLSSLIWPILVIGSLLVGYIWSFFAK